MEEEKNLGADSEDLASGEEAEEEKERLGFEPTEDELVLHFLRPQLVRCTPAGGAGSWMHSGNREQGRSVTALGVVAQWSRTRYVFYTLGGEEGRRSTGWVMAEYEITDPGCYRRADEEEEDDERWQIAAAAARTTSTIGFSATSGGAAGRRAGGVCLRR